MNPDAKLTKAEGSLLDRWLENAIKEYPSGPFGFIEDLLDRKIPLNTADEEKIGQLRGAIGKISVEQIPVFAGLFNKIQNYFDERLQGARTK